MRRLAGLVLALGGLGLLGVLGGALPAAAGEPRVGPCDLLTRKEVRAAFGQPAGRPSSELGPAFCQWQLAATDLHAPGQVNTLLERGKAAKRDYRLGERLAGPLAQPIAGLGTKAFFTPDTNTLFVLTAGPTLLYVQANVYDADANRISDGLLETMVDLATRAEGRV